MSKNDWYRQSCLRLVRNLRAKFEVVNRSNIFIKKKKKEKRETSLRLIKFTKVHSNSLSINLYMTLNNTMSSQSKKKTSKPSKISKVARYLKTKVRILNCSLWIDIYIVTVCLRLDVYVTLDTIKSTFATLFPPLFGRLFVWNFKMIEDVFNQST